MHWTFYLKASAQLCVGDNKVLVNATLYTELEAARLFARREILRPQERVSEAASQLHRIGYVS